MEKRQAGKINEMDYFIKKFNFFELKFLITDSFYSEALKNGYSYEQSAGICYEAFSEYINKGGAECVVALSSILRLILRHDLQLTEYDIKNLNKALSLFGQIDMKNILTESEYEYLEEDILILEHKHKELK